MRGSGEDPLSDLLTEKDMMVLIGTKEEPGFCPKGGPQVTLAAMHT